MQFNKQTDFVDDGDEQSSGLLASNLERFSARSVEFGAQKEIHITTKRKKKPTF